MRTFRTDRAVVGGNYTLEAVPANVLRFDIIGTLPGGQHAYQGIASYVQGRTETDVLNEEVTNSFTAILAIWGWDESFR